MEGREHPLMRYLEEAGKDKTREEDQLLLLGEEEGKYPTTDRLAPK